MINTLGSANISRARVQVPRYGIPSAVIALTDDTVLTIPSAQLLTIGNLAAYGTVFGGQDFGGQAGYTWAGGAGRWSTIVAEAPPYHNANGVMLSVVAADLARDAGEVGAVLDGISDRSLGTNWTRPVAPARDLLDALTGGGAGVQGQWWVNLSDGVTHIGPRPASAFTSTTLTVHYDPALRIARAQLADDNVAGLVPGAALTAQGLTSPLTILSTALEVEDDEISVMLYGELVGPELFRAMVGAVTQWKSYLQLNPYTVAGPGGDPTVPNGVAVQPMDQRSAAFPDAPAFGHVAGIPGASYTLARGAGCLVVHIAGDPGSPVVFGHLPGVLPLTLLVDAQTSITLGAGGTSLVKDAPLQAWVAALTTACAAHGITVPALTGEATTKLLGA